MRSLTTPFSRRGWLQSTACGFGALAATGLAAAPITHAPRLPQPHFAPRAKRIIFLFMQGGVSHVDRTCHRSL